MTFRYQPFPVAPLPPGLCAATVHFLTLVHHSPQHQAVNDPKVLFTTEVIPKRECDGRADVLPAFHTSPSMISDEGKGKRYVEEQAHGGADDWGAEAVGSGS